MSEQPQPTLPGRGFAHRIIDFLWDEVHVSSGAFVLILVSFIFIAAVYKIDNSNNHKQAKITAGICHVVADSNHNVDATKARIQSAVSRADGQAAAERKLAATVRLGAKHEHGLFRKLFLRLAAGHTALSKLDDEAAADLRVQLAAVQPITLPGC